MNPQKARQQRRKDAQRLKRRLKHIASSLSDVALTRSMIVEFIEEVTELPILRAIGYQALRLVETEEKLKRALADLDECQQLIDLHRMRQANPDFKPMVSPDKRERRGTKPSLSFRARGGNYF